MLKFARANRMRIALFLLFAVIFMSVPALAVSSENSTEMDRAVSWCMDLNIASGYSDGDFHAGEPVSAKAFSLMCGRTFGNSEANYVISGDVTRYEAARVLSAAMKRAKISVDEYDRLAAEKSIKDYGLIPEAYKTPVCTMYARGIMSGRSDGNFHGDAVLTRGQAAVLVYRAAGLLGDAPLISYRLPDGKEITEENVFARIVDLKSKYPCNKEFKGYDSLKSNYKQDENSIKAIVERYVVTGSEDDLCSTETGCGGWAAFVCDYIFGQNAKFHETTLDKIRPGDLMLKLDSAGKLAHVQVCTSRVRSESPERSVRITNANNGLGIPTAAGTTEYKINWTNVLTSGSKWAIYTAYPD